MPEVAAVGEDHRGSGSHDSLDHFLVALRAAGLDESRDARVERELRPVREGEERIRGENGPLERMTELARLLDREPDRVDPARLPRADPERLAAARYHDRVRGDVLHDAPREQQVVPAIGRDLAADYVRAPSVGLLAVPALDEEPAQDAPVVALVFVRRPLLSLLEHAHGGLACEDLERLPVEGRREQHLDELARELLCERTL